MNFAFVNAVVILMKEEDIELINQARADRRKGDLLHARTLLDLAVQLTHEHDHHAKGTLYNLYAQLHRDEKSMEKAIEMYTLALSAFQKEDSELDVAHTLRHLADIETELGQNEKAREKYARVLKIYNDHPDVNKVNLANALRGQAILMEHINNNAEAVKSWKEAQKIYKEAGITAGVDECKRHLQSQD